MTNLPQLTGTPKQIEWAEQIRAAAAAEWQQIVDLDPNKYSSLEELAASLSDRDPWSPQREGILQVALFRRPELEEDPDPIVFMTELMNRRIAAGEKILAVASADFWIDFRGPGMIWRFIRDHIQEPVFDDEPVDGLDDRLARYL